MMKPFFRFIALSSALFLILFSGCIDFDLDLDFVTFANPTVAPDDAKVHTELFGSFTLEEPEGDQHLASLKSSVIHVGRAEEGFPAGFLRTAFAEISHKGEISLADSHECFASKIGDFYVLNLPNEKQDKEGEIGDDQIKGTEKDKEDKEPAPEEKITKWIPENYEGYMLLLMKPTKTGFTVSLLNEDFLRSEVAAERLDGKCMTDQQKEEFKKKRKQAKKEKKVFDEEWTPFVIEAKPEELRAFFERNEKEIIGEPLFILKRVE